MKTPSLLIALLIFLVACGGPTESRTPLPFKDDAKEVTPKAENNAPPEISKADLDSLRTILRDPLLLEEQLRRLGYVKKYNGVFTTPDSDSNGKPSSWITATDIGPKSTLSYKTSKVMVFSRLRQEIAVVDRTTTAIGERNQFFVKLEGDPYTYELHTPKGGVNTTLNEYYEIIIYPKGAY